MLVCVCVVAVKLKQKVALPITRPRGSFGDVLPQKAEQFLQKIIILLSFRLRSFNLWWIGLLRRRTKQLEISKVDEVFQPQENAAL